MTSTGEDSLELPEMGPSLSSSGSDSGENIKVRGADAGAQAHQSYASYKTAYLHLL